MRNKGQERKNKMRRNKKGRNKNISLTLQVRNMACLRTERCDTNQIILGLLYWECLPEQHKPNRTIDHPVISRRWRVFPFVFHSSNLNVTLSPLQKQMDVLIHFFTSFKWLSFVHSLLIFSLPDMISTLFSGGISTIFCWRALPFSMHMANQWQIYWLSIFCNKLRAKLLWLSWCKGIR